MYCPFCRHHETKVTDKRDSEKETKRRRECLKCERRFTTFEKVEPIEIVVIKKDGRKEEFSREKLKAGLLKAVEKRPVKEEDVDKAVMELEESFNKKGKEISSKEIGEAVMKKLKKLDKVAYIRFASVYRGFQSIDDFRNAVKEVGK
jgi:transcriptional repressor NrdR